MFPVCPYGVPDNYENILEMVSEEFEVPATLLHAVVYQETRCNMDAIGSQGEIGLMQLHPVVWAHPANWLLMKEGTGWDSFQEAYNGTGPAAEQYAHEVLRIWEQTDGTL
jgi:hypothetical protein